MCRLGPEASALPEATHRHRDIRKGSLARVTSALLSGAYVSRALRGMHVLRPSRNDPSLELVQAVVHVMRSVLT